MINKIEMASHDNTFKDQTLMSNMKVWEIKTD